MNRTRIVSQFFRNNDETIVLEFSILTIVYYIRVKSGLRIWPMKGLNSILYLKRVIFCEIKAYHEVPFVDFLFHLAEIGSLRLCQKIVTSSGETNFFFSILASGRVFFISYSDVFCTRARCAYRFWQPKFFFYLAEIRNQICS